MGTIRGHTKAVLCLAAMEDLECSGSADNSVRIWMRGINISCSCLAVFEDHKRPVKCLAAVVDFYSTVSHGGSDQSGSSYLVYSGSLDCDVMVWKIWVPLL
ncbi:myosin heavy chain kinase B [Quillaja saponaria]|uniref:Myosin heavy chain kinase B n=1 Tax=Quillaja saponaria TaxID=32244 RepID=A0AAD7KPI2_QUISA|nr:myosin heavy chain kinase B [Quillaja saponaria]